MKHLQTFENKRIDRVLDKISKYGVEKLTDLDKRFLNDVDNEELKAEMKNRDMRVSGLWDYDPREDKEFFGELSDDVGVDFDFSKYDDNMIEEGRYEIMYDEMDEKDIIHFEDTFKIADMQLEDGYKPWDKLSPETQEKFKEYLTELY